MNGCWNGSRVNCMRNYSLPSGHLCLLHSISSAISDGSKSRGSKAITFSSVIPSSRLSFPSFASIYISISSTSFPSRFDHSPISSRDHDRAYFVLEIQMVPHFFFFATNGLLGAIDPIDGGTKELRNSPSPSHFWFIKIGWIATHLHFFHSLPRKLQLSSLRAQVWKTVFYAGSMYKKSNPYVDPPHEVLIE